MDIDSDAEAKLPTRVEESPTRGERSGELPKRVEDSHNMVEMCEEKAREERIAMDEENALPVVQDYAHTRKRMRSPGKWKASKAKARRNSCIAYLSRASGYVSSKTAKP